MARDAFRPLLLPTDAREPYSEKVKEFLATAGEKRPLQHREEGVADLQKLESAHPVAGVELQQAPHPADLADPLPVVLRDAQL